MSIKFACTCGKAYKVPEKYAGKRVRCKNCGETVAVPSSSAPISSARASAVSHRSVMGSGRHEHRADEDEEAGEAERDGDEAEARRRGPISARSPAIVSARVQSISERRPGGDTRRFSPLDITTELKKYVKKRDDDALGKGMGKLTLFENGKASKSFRLDKEEKVIGRSSRCAITLESRTISKQHARIEYKLGTFIATDLKSLNGLVVNGKPVRRASLRDDDIIQIGDVILRFEQGK